jgi:exopolysaccharide production protein ExoQ
MSSQAALWSWLCLLLILLRFDASFFRQRSAAVWVPILWMFIAATRLPSQWMTGEVSILGTESMEQGNPMDRMVYLALIAFAIGTLIYRSMSFRRLLQQNFALTLFLAFCLMSVLWSDFAMIALKRWVRDLGDYLVILVILSDREPIEAIRAVLRRLCFISVSLSIVFVKYFPALGIHYSIWTGAPEYVGVATSKNTLGALCLISILTFYWNIAVRWHDQRKRRTRLMLCIDGAFIAMSCYLLHLCNSDTSLVCAVMGCLFMTAVCSKIGQRHLTAIKVTMPLSFIIYLILDVGFGMNSAFAAQLGRDPNLTGRTEIWENLLKLHTNPLVGTGYQTFWIGPRLEEVWRLCGHINEAHNGYLDTYLQLGLIGLGLLLYILVTSYMTICRRLDQGTELASFSAAMWTLLLFYCITEAAFIDGMMWMVFLLVTIVVQRPKRQVVRSFAQLRGKRPEYAGATELSLPVESSALLRRSVASLTRPLHQ